MFVIFAKLVVIGFGLRGHVFHLVFYCRMPAITTDISAWL
jgi:hypothetical protein